jgi:hypothetical protein
MSADRDWNTTDVDDDVISGDVVSRADDDTLDEDVANARVTSTPAPETYLHKVAGPHTDRDPLDEDPDEADDAALEDSATTAYPATAYPAATDPAVTDPDLPVATDLTDRDTDVPDAVPDADLRDADLQDDDVPVTGRHAFPDADTTEPAASDSATPDFPAPESAVPESAVPVDAVPVDAVSGSTVADTAVPVAAVPEAVSPAAGANVRAPMARRPGDETNLTSSVTADDSLLGDSGPLLAQWKQAQAGFVEDPRASLNEAAGVVADAASMLEAAIRERQENLRGEWDVSGKADTETLRQAMLVYRRLLDKLVS